MKKFTLVFFYLISLFSLPSVATAQNALHQDVKNLINVWLDAQMAYDDIPFLSASYVDDQQIFW